MRVAEHRHRPVVLAALLLCVIIVLFPQETLSTVGTAPLRTPPPHPWPLEALKSDLGLNVPCSMDMSRRLQDMLIKPQPPNCSNFLGEAADVCRSLLTCREAAVRVWNWEARAAYDVCVVSALAALSMAEHGKPAFYESVDWKEQKSVKGPGGRYYRSRWAAWDLVRVSGIVLPLVEPNHPISPPMLGGTAAEADIDEVAQCVRAVQAADPEQKLFYFSGLKAAGEVKGGEFEALVARPLCEARVRFADSGLYAETFEDKWAKVVPAWTQYFGRLQTGAGWPDAPRLRADGKALDALAAVERVRAASEAKMQTVGPPVLDVDLTAISCEEIVQRLQEISSLQLTCIPPEKPAFIVGLYHSIQERYGEFLTGRRRVLLFVLVLLTVLPLALLQRGRSWIWKWTVLLVCIPSKIWSVIKRKIFTNEPDEIQRMLNNPQAFDDVLDKRVRSLWSENSSAADAVLKSLDPCDEWILRIGEIRGILRELDAACRGRAKRTQQLTAAREHIRNWIQSHGPTTDSAEQCSGTSIDAKGVTLCEADGTSPENKLPHAAGSNATGPEDGKTGDASLMENKNSDRSDDTESSGENSNRDAIRNVKSPEGSAQPEALEAMSEQPSSDHAPGLTDLPQSEQSQTTALSDEGSRLRQSDELGCDKLLGTASNASCDAVASLEDLLRMPGPREAGELLDSAEDLNWLYRRVSQLRQELDQASEYERQLLESVKCLGIDETKLAALEEWRSIFHERDDWLKILSGEQHGILLRLNNALADKCKTRAAVEMNVKKIGEWLDPREPAIHEIFKSILRKPVGESISQLCYTLEDHRKVCEVLGLFDLEAIGPELKGQRCERVKDRITIESDPKLIGGSMATVEEVRSWGVRTRGNSPQILHRARVMSGIWS